MGQRWSTQAREAEPDASLAEGRLDALRPPLEASAKGSMPDAKILCILVHGIEGSSEDMQVWKERIEVQHPDWHFLLASSITPTCKVVGDGIDKLGNLLANEVTEHLKSLGGSISLHFICHSLGGLVARAALAGVMANAETARLDVSYGHFVSLNSPHLGIRSGHPFTCWKNMGDIVPGRLGLLRLVHQMTLQDRDSTEGSSDTLTSSDSGRSRSQGRPFLEQLADANGKHCQALGAFRQRTAVAATHWDVMVPCCTAAICSKNTFPSPSIFTGQVFPFWRLDAAVGFEGELLQYHESGGEAAAKFKQSIDEVQQQADSHQESDSRSDLLRKSSDSEVEFRPKMLHGLSSLTWGRVAYTVHFPFADVHLFSIGKDRKLRSWSIEFIDLMIKNLLQ